MAKVTVTLDAEVQADLMKLVPPRNRSRVINEALRKELLHQKKSAAMAALTRLRKVTGTFTADEIVSTLRKDRGRR